MTVTLLGATASVHAVTGLASAGTWGEWENVGECRNVRWVGGRWRASAPGVRGRA